jgi:hypothetical protein
VSVSSLHKPRASAKADLTGMGPERLRIMGNQGGLETREEGRTSHVGPQGTVWC